MIKRSLALFLSLCMLLSCVTVMAVSSSGETNRVPGIENSSLPGGMATLSEQINFSDLFEEDGSNGTNGTIKNEDGGLIAKKTSRSLQYVSKSTQTKGPKRDEVILDRTFSLPTTGMTNDAQYYMEFAINMNPQGSISFDFGRKGDKSGWSVTSAYGEKVLKVTSGDKEVGSIPYVWATASKEFDQVKTLGFLVNPVTKEFVVLADGAVVSKAVSTYTGETPDSLRVTWRHSSPTGHWTMNVHNKLDLLTFNVYTVSDEMTEQEKAEEDKQAIDLGDLHAVTENLTLPLLGSVHGSSISWKSNNTDVIRIDGGIGVVSRGQKDTTVELTATVINGQVSVDKVFSVTVKGSEIPSVSDEEKVDEDLASLTLENTEAVTADFALPVLGSVHGSSISWKSNREDVIAVQNGKAVVTRQTEDVAVTLTATAQIEAVKKNKSFTVTVKAKEKEEAPAVTEINKNLALKKKVTGNKESYSSTYDYGAVTDGDLTSRLALKDWVDLNGGWIQIDLERVYRFNQINLVEFNKRLKKFKLQYSVDGSVWNDIGTYTTDADNQAGTFNHEPYTFDTVEGRYVRLYILENVKLASGQYVGASIYEMEVWYTGEYLLSYNPNATQGQEGYMSSATPADYGITVPSTSWGASINSVSSDVLTSLSGKKGIMISPRRQTDVQLRETGTFLFENDKINQPKPFDDMENGYVYEQEFTSYLRPNLDGDAIWQYRLLGKDANGEIVTVAGLETVLTKADGKLPEAQNGMIYGTAKMMNTENSSVIAFPGQASNGKAASAHISFLRIYVDMKNQTYTAWLVTRADVNNAYSEKEPEKAELLVRDEPFSVSVKAITGVQVWSQNTYGDQTHFLKMGIRKFDNDEVAVAAWEALSEEDILGENISADQITTALNLMRVYQHTQVAWSASPQGIVGEDGGVIVAPQEDMPVTLTAVLKRSDVVKEKQFTVTVSPSAEAETDERKVEIEAEQLSLGDLSAVTEDLNLITAGPSRGCNIRWESSNEAVIAPDGKVNRPLRDEKVTLTAVISKGKAQRTKQFEATVKGTQESCVIEGIEGSYFSGGTFYETGKINFADLFEGDGSNGTNGTVYVEPSTETDAEEREKKPGLVAEKKEDGIRFACRVHNAVNQGRGLPIFEKTYNLPKIEDLSKPYYLEIAFQMKAVGSLTFDLGENEGTAESPSGGKGVIQIRKKDGNKATPGVNMAGTPEGPAAYDYKIQDVTKATADYTDNENATLGIYVIPELKEMVFYKNGERVSDKIFSYSNPDSALETLKITWNQDIRYYGISSGDYLLLKNICLYQGPEMPDSERIKLDVQNMTFASISSEKENSVTKDLNLYTKAKFGSSVVWSSDMPEIINPVTGAVTRQTEAKTVTLRAVLSIGGETAEKIFTVTVPKKGTDGNLAAGAKVTIDGTSSIEDLSNLTDGIFETYIETLDAGKTPKITIDFGENKQFSRIILYEGMAEDDYAIQKGIFEVSTDGMNWTEVEKVTEVGPNLVIDFLPVEARYIRFCITEMDEKSTVRLYEMEVVMAASDDEIIRADMRELKAFEEYSVSQSTVFVTSGKFGSKIRWSTSDSSLVDETGKVTRPVGAGKVVTVTAHLTYGKAENTLDFNHYIEGRGTNGGGSARPQGGGSGGGGSVSGGGGLVNVVDDESQKPEPEEPEQGKFFPDVEADSWALPYIKNLYEAGIVSGNPEGYFEPMRPILREEYVKLLLLSLEVDIQSDRENVFTDVSGGDWFSDYVNTAYALGLVTGMPDGTFGVGQQITRQDMAVMTKRAADVLGIELSQKNRVSLADMEKVSDYARESVQALANAGLISGDENGYFNPYGSALREQAAKIICLMRGIK